MSAARGGDDEGEREGGHGHGGEEAQVPFCGRLEVQEGACAGGCGGEGEEGGGAVGCEGVGEALLELGLVVARELRWGRRGLFRRKGVESSLRGSGKWRRMAEGGDTVLRGWYGLRLIGLERMCRRTWRGKSWFCRGRPS